MTLAVAEALNPNKSNQSTVSKVQTELSSPFMRTFNTGLSELSSAYALLTDPGPYEYQPQLLPTEWSWLPYYQVLGTDPGTSQEDFLNVSPVVCLVGSSHVIRIDENPGLELYLVWFN